MKQLLAVWFFLPLAFFSTQVLSQNATDQSVTSVLWMQKSAEYRALCYQAYNLAEWRVKEYLSQKDTTGKPAAVIFDLDETLLDNSPSEALNIMEGKGYTDERWKAWTDQASAAPIPGGVEFCHFLARNGIQPFYVTNRTSAESTATLLNMQKWNFPYANRNHLYFKSQTSSKEARRNNIGNQYHIILLVGANLADFDQVFEDRSDHFGFPAVDSLRQELGRKFILLPNPVYGDWTKPLSGDRKSWLNTKTSGDQ